MLKNQKELLAVRAITPRAYKLKNGNILIEAELLDSFHLIHIALEIGSQERKIVKAKAEMKEIPHADICPIVLTKVKRLKGLVIRKGILKDVSEILGGEAGCVHLRNLATIAIDFAAWVLMESIEDEISKKEFLKGTCLAYPKGG